MTAFVARRLRCETPASGSVFASATMPRGSVAENSSVRRVGRRGLEDEFHILAKAEIEHLVGFVEHDGLQLRDVEPAAPQMVAAAGRACRPRCGRPPPVRAVRARIHAADAGDHARIGILVEPREFALHLQAPVRASARRSAPAVRRRARTARRRRAGPWRSPAHRRRSCPSRFAPKPAGRGPPRRLPARRSAPRWRNRSCARSAPGQAAGWWLRMSRAGKPWLALALKSRIRLRTGWVEARVPSRCTAAWDD